MRPATRARATGLASVDAHLFSEPAGVFTKAVAEVGDGLAHERSGAGCEPRILTHILAEPLQQLVHLPHEIVRCWLCLLGFVVGA